jgi:uncharacterized protein (TIGR01777 family)
MRVLVTGSSGLVGTALLRALAAQADEPIALVRRPPGPGERPWTPDRGELDPRVLDGIDAVVHLAGEGVATGRWTAARKGRIQESRLRGTRALALAIVQANPRPGVLVCASASGFYGDRGDEALTEEAPRGTGFLAELCEAWEAAARPAREAGVRTVHLRFGIILSRNGGALRTMLPAFRLGLGGRLGSGRQWAGYLSLEDALGIIRFALRSGISGPVNAAVGSVTNREFTKALGRALGRPTLLPVPAPLLRLLLGEMARELLLASTRLVPAVLQRAGFLPLHPTIDEALAAALHEE